MFNFLHLELTSRCQKKCAMCGRRKIEKDHPDLVNWGDMPFEMVEEISWNVNRGTLVQFFNNGEPLLYPRLGDALELFDHCIRQFNTNAKLLMEKADEIIDNLDILTISVIENDPEGDEQYEIVKAFITEKGDHPPRMVYRLLGQVENHERWEALPGITVRRVLHSPMGSRDYKKPVVKPEHTICLDLLTHMAIDRYGNVSLCVRFDPLGLLKIGSVSEGLEVAWESDKRQEYIKHHIAGRRDLCPGCDVCHFYGCPTG